MVALPARWLITMSYCDESTGRRGERRIDTRPPGAQRASGCVARKRLRAGCASPRGPKRATPVLQSTWAKPNAAELEEIGQLIAMEHVHPHVSATLRLMQAQAVHRKLETDH